MSLFDDFYSTKVSRRHKVHYRGFRNNRWQTAGLLLLASIGGAMIMLAVLLILPERDKEAVLPASALFHQDTEQAGRSLNLLVQKAAARVNPAVVSIISKQKEKDDDESYSFGLGSGVVFQKKDGRAEIITNNHVIQGADEVEVVLANGEHKKAKVKGADKYFDLALLDVDDKGIREVAELGDSDRIELGETAIAIGNPLGLGYSPTVTMGVISNTKRTIDISLNDDGVNDWQMEVIQTDAAINQGNSGGALVNIDGQVIGINSRKVLDTGVEGLGFAIPINDVKTVINSLMKYGKVNRPYLGVTSQDLQEFEGLDDLKLPKNVQQGVFVLEVTGPAEKAGIQQEDVIVKLDHTTVTSTMDLRRYLFLNKQPGDKVKVEMYRKGVKRTVEVVLAAKSDG